MSDKITIIRATKNADNPYVILRKNVAQDRSLSWEARGMLTYILSHPDDWKVIPKDLQQKCGGGKVYSILNELIDAGYIERRVVRDEKKRFTTWQYLVYETPQPIKSDIENEPLLTFPQMAQPQMENRDALLSTEESLSIESLKETLAPQETGAVSPALDDTPTVELKSTVPPGPDPIPVPPEDKVKKQRPRNLMFDTIAEYSFGIHDTTQTKKDGGRIGKILRWLKANEPDCTPDMLKMFYQWYDRKVGVDRPRHDETFTLRWQEWKQSAISSRPRTLEPNEAPPPAPVYPG